MSNRDTTIGRIARRAALAACLWLGLAACAATFTNHGFVPREDELQALAVGTATRDTVAETVGRPPATGVLSEQAWIYSAYRVRNFTYRAPEVIEREVVAISFDDRGLVSNIERFGLEDGRVVTLSRRVTESSVRDLGFIRQILGNLGRLDLGNLGG
jgi:outer membrane protein assembly factor BamE (lipoprotein component of BamABCDE complex)